ncbi:MAG: hypothetical protein JWP11_3575 [Frankiales bacterium]|nr:hypothetical protein [Frankiales bacterium]
MTDIEDLLSRTLSDDRRGLSAPPSALDAVTRAERRITARRRMAAAGAAALTAVGVVVGAAMAIGNQAADDRLVPHQNASDSAAPSLTASAFASPSLLPLPSRAAIVPATADGSPGAGRRTSGVVTDGRGRRLAGIRILSADASVVLGRTSRDGSFSVTCVNGLLFAAYAFGPDYWTGPSRPTESSPGAGNYAFRSRPRRDCGHRIAVVMPAGGVVEGHADARRGATIRLSRVVGGVDGPNPKRFGSFESIVRRDGTYRIEGLAAGRYSIESSHDGFPDEATFVDVHEGRTSDGSYTMWIDPAACGDPWTDPNCGGSAPPSASAEPSPEPSPTPTS